MLKKLKKIDPDIIIYFAVVIFLAYNMAFVDDSFKHFRNVAFIWTYFVVSRRQIRLDIGDALIFTGMLSFYWIWKYSFLKGLILGLKVTSMYQIGKYIAEYAPVDTCGENRNDLKVPVAAVVIIALALFVRGLLNYSYLMYYPDALDEEIWPMWIGWGAWNDVDIPRTHHEFFLILMGSLIGFWILLIFRKNKIRGMIGLTLSIIAIFLGVFSRGRMTFFCSAGAMLFMIVAMIAEKELLRKSIFRIMGVIMAILFFLLIVLYKQNCLGIKDWFEHSMWVGSGGIVHNVRLELMKESIQLLKDYPLGHCDVMLIPKYNNVPYDHAHNSWLEIGRRGGIIPLLITLFFTLYNFYTMLRITFKEKGIFKYAIISAFIGITLYNGFEAAIMASERYLYWNTEVVLGGILTGYYLHDKNKERSIRSLICLESEHLKNNIS